MTDKQTRLIEPQQRVCDHVGVVGEETNICSHCGQKCRWDEQESIWIGEDDE